MTGELRLNRRWMIGDAIGQGAFGRVYEARSDQGQVAAAKLVPYGPAANTRIPQVDLQCVRNVVQVIDSGRHGEHFVVVMQKAVESLRELMDLAHGPIPAHRVLRVLRDVALALVDLDGRVIHRDIKPANVLLVEGHWCLADFGREFAMSPAYAAPERWRNEGAVPATDVYALGVVGFEMLAGRLPFVGRSMAALRDQHLHSDPPRVDGMPARLRVLIDDCLSKEPEARPTPISLMTRVEQLVQSLHLAHRAGDAGAPSTQWLSSIRHDSGRVGPTASRQAPAQDGWV